MVNRAADQDSPETRKALGVLCQAYWYPLYAFVRRKGHTKSDAEDMIQAFFAEVVEKNKLSIADQTRGRFRSFMLTSLDHFMKNDWRSRQAAIRGGGVAIVSIDYEVADERYTNEPSHELTPEKIFLRNWTLSVLEQTMLAVRQQYEQSGKSELFDAIKIYLGEAASVPYQEVAKQLEMKEGAVKVAVHRLRVRYGEQLRLQIARTIDNVQDVDDELASLLKSLESR